MQDPLVPECDEDKRGERGKSLFNLSLGLRSGGKAFKVCIYTYVIRAKKTLA